MGCILLLTRLSQRHGLFQIRWASRSPPSSLVPRYTKTYFIGFAGNDSPSFVFPTAIAIKGSSGGGGSSGSGRPAVAQKPSYLTGGAGPSGHLSAKRGTEDLDYFIGDEAAVQALGPGTGRCSFGRSCGAVLLWGQNARFQ